MIVLYTNIPLAFVVQFSFFFACKLCWHLCMSFIWYEQVSRHYRASVFIRSMARSLFALAFIFNARLQLSLNHSVSIYDTAKWMNTSTSRLFAHTEELLNNARAQKSCNRFQLGFVTTMSRTLKPNMCVCMEGGWRTWTTDKSLGTDPLKRCKQFLWGWMSSFVLARMVFVLLGWWNSVSAGVWLVCGRRRSAVWLGLLEEPAVRQQVVGAGTRSRCFRNK